MAGPHHEYTARMTWTGNTGAGTRSYAGYGRSWRIAVAGKPDIAGSADPRFRGDPACHNPEDLFLAALSSCHMLSYLALCARRGITVTAYEDDARGTMSMNAGGGRFEEVVLRPVVTVVAGSDEILAVDLHHVAHELCFIASSVSVPVLVQPKVVLEAEGTA